MMLQKETISIGRRLVAAGLLFLFVLGTVGSLALGTAAQHPAQNFPQFAAQIKRGGLRRRASSRWIWSLFATSSDFLRAWCVWCQ